MSTAGPASFAPTLENPAPQAYNSTVTKSAKLGQNFLRDKGVAQRIVELVPAGTGPLLEIGPGQGILSERLLARFPGRPLVLVEVDPLLAEELRPRFGGLERPDGRDQARVVGGDILEVDLAAMFSRKEVTVIGNLPYHISKPLVDWFIAQHQVIGATVLMLQKDFVDKLLAPPGGKKYNAQSVAFQLLFQTRRRFDVPAGAFVPKPKIVSTVITSQPLTPALGNGSEFYTFAKLCFAKRRKTLWNNLSSHYSAATLTTAFAAAVIPAQARAEQLEPRRFIVLWEILHGSRAGGGG